MVDEWIFLFFLPLEGGFNWQESHLSSELSNIVPQTLGNLVGGAILFFIHWAILQAGKSFTGGKLLLTKLR